VVNDAPAALPPGKTRYPLYRSLGGTQGRSGRVRKISSPPRFYTRTLQPVMSRYFGSSTLLVVVKTFLCLRLNVTERQFYTVAYQARGFGDSTPPPPRNSEVLTKLSRIPVPWKIHPKEPNQNTGFAHLQIEWNLWLGGYRPQIPVSSALCPQLNLLNPPSPPPRTIVLAEPRHPLPKKILGTPLVSEYIWKSLYSTRCLAHCKRVFPLGQCLILHCGIFV
jgi:hypothetical protein